MTICSVVVQWCLNEVVVVVVVQTLMFHVVMRWCVCTEDVAAVVKNTAVVDRRRLYNRVTVR